LDGIRLKKKGSTKRRSEMSEQNALILIVNDDTEMLQFLSRLMKAEGFRAIEARDGRTALKLLSSESPDLMLLDLRMQDMDGMEVLRRTKDLNRNLPVIVLSGYHETQWAVKVIKAGAYEYFAKPFEGNELTRTVCQALSERTPKRKLGEVRNRLERAIP
jgi:DNA-binding NtrC family response regulator